MSFYLFETLHNPKYLPIYAPEETIEPVELEDDAQPQTPMRIQHFQEVPSFDGGCFVLSTVDVSFTVT